MGSTFSNILLHIVFSTKHRKNLIHPEMQPRLYEYIGGIVRSKKGVLYSIGGMPDHLHLLLRWTTTGTVADLLMAIKSSSSGWIHEAFEMDRDFAWQDGYAVFSVSQSQAKKVEQYIQQQVEHHRKASFQDELRSLLKAHQIPFDERYIWQ